MLSLRYPSQLLDARLQLMRLCGWLQGRPVVALRADPEACARVLAASNTKGQFIEQLIACPAWAPVRSIESVDGEEWRALARTFRQIMARLDTTTVAALTRAHVRRLAARCHADASFVLDAEQVSRLAANVLFELVFGRALTGYEEDVCYRASLEWRKEIAVKGTGSPAVKQQFWGLLEELVAASPFAADLAAAPDRTRFLSAFAQPLVLSPQINFADIMARVFGELDRDAALDARAVRAAHDGDLAWLRGLCLEAIRLGHPFPVLERELETELTLGDRVLAAGTQVFILLDQLEQDRDVVPERWSQGARNPYRAIPFGVGPRMCVGKHVAQDMLGELLAGMLRDLPRDQVQPRHNHLYSGRDNDAGDSLRTAFYQLRVFGGVLARSWALRPRRGAAPAAAPAAGCPVHRAGA